MDISILAKNMPVSPIRKLYPYANEAKRQGVKVYHLNIGQPDIKTPQCGLDALKHITRTTLEYSPSDGIMTLRKTIADYYAGYGVSLKPEEVMITTGGSEAVFFTFLACLSPGDEVIVPTPFYANYRAFAAITGAVIKTVSTHIEEGFQLPSIDAFEQAITPRTKAIFICNPNNPTGYLYTKEEILRLREIALEHDLYIFADEVYREFNYSDKPYFSVLELEGVDDNVIVIDSVSKRYSECGVRVGCICTHNAQVRAAVMRFCQARLSPPLLGQIVAEASYGVQKEYLKGVWDEYKDRRDFLIEGLNKIPGVFSPMPQGAFYTVASLPVDNSEDFCIWCLKEFRYEGTTVMMAPASGFYSNPEEGRHQVRIAYVLCREDLAEALVVLQKALEAYPGRTI